MYLKTGIPEEDTTIYDFGRTATRSISTKAPRAPAGRATCIVVRAGLLGWSLVPTTRNPDRMGF